MGGFRSLSSALIDAGSIEPKEAQMLLVRTPRCAEHDSRHRPVCRRVGPQRHVDVEISARSRCVGAFAVIEKLPPLGRELLNHYGYLSEFFPGGYVLNCDNARFINHSDDPNTDNTTEFSYALRDIQPGEEITCDYRDVCKTFVGV